MRRILIENARRKRSEKRGGDRKRVDLAEADPVSMADPCQLVELDDALTQLEHQDREAAELVKLRLFAGLSVEQASDLLGISRTAAYRHWAYARAWLNAQLR